MLVEYISGVAGGIAVVLVGTKFFLETFFFNI
jgi:hypothetical protein